MEHKRKGKALSFLCSFMSLGLYLAIPDMDPAAEAFGYPCSNALPPCQGGSFRSISYFRGRHVYVLHRQNKLEEPCWSYGLLNGDLKEALPFQYNELACIGDSDFYLQKNVKGGDGRFRYQNGFYTRTFG